jgi:hypothetical protein
MTNGISPADADFSAVTAALRRGDFSALDPLFALSPPERSPLVDWVREGKFAVDRTALNEALTCACFNGRTEWIPLLLERPAHSEIVATLLEAGADAHAVDYPSGITAIDALLKRYRDGR